MSPEAGGVCGVVLAGGRARRMGGGDKCLLDLGGRPLLDRIIARARPQVAALLINANGDTGRLAHYGLPVASDVITGFAGPLAGILTGLEWSRAHDPQCRWVASFAADTPFFPQDMVAQLLAAVEAGAAEIGCCVSAGRTHPVFGLWPVRLADDLRTALQAEGLRKIDAWTARYRTATVDFSADGVDPFFNINAPDDLQHARALLQDAGLRP